MSMQFFITTGVTADYAIAVQLTEGFQDESLLADRGYDTDAIILKAVDVDRTLVLPFCQGRIKISAAMR